MNINSFHNDKNAKLITNHQLMTFIIPHRQNILTLSTKLKNKLTIYSNIKTIKITTDILLKKIPQIMTYFILILLSRIVKNLVKCMELL